MTVQRDGPTRLSLEWQAAQAGVRNGAQTSACMFRIADGCTDFDDDTCGVPHSMLDPKDEILHPPYNIYWQSFLNSAVASFASGRAKSVGVAAFSGSNIGECVTESVQSPDISRVGVVIKGILQLESGFVMSPGNLDILLFNSLVSQLKQPMWSLSFTRLEDPFQQGLNRFFLMEFPDYIRTESHQVDVQMTLVPSVEGCSSADQPAVLRVHFAQRKCSFLEVCSQNTQFDGSFMCEQIV